MKLNPLPFDPNRLMLRDTAGQRTSIAVSDVREERVIPLSLMPEGLGTVPTKSCATCSRI